MHSTTPLDTESADGQLKQEEQNDFVKFGSFLKENIGQHLRSKCIDFTLPTSTDLSSDTLDPTAQYTAAAFSSTITTSSSATTSSVPLLSSTQPCQEQDQNIMSNTRNRSFDAAG